MTVYDRERVARVLARLPPNLRQRLEGAVQELIEQDIAVPAPSLLRLSALTLEQYSRRMLPKHAIVAWMFAVVLRERTRLLTEAPGRAGPASEPPSGAGRETDAQSPGVDAPGPAPGLSSPGPGPARVSA